MICVKDVDIVQIERNELEIISRLGPLNLFDIGDADQDTLKPRLARELIKGQKFILRTFSKKG